MIARYASLTFAVLLLCTVSPSLTAAEPEHSNHPHHLAGVVGVASHESRDGRFLGLEYEYRLNEKWGIGGYYEQTFDGFDLEALGLMATYHPGQNWRLLGGIGGEGKLNTDKTKLLVRAAIAYDFHVGSVSLSPLLAIDWIEDNSYVVYLGLGVGFGF